MHVNCTYFKNGIVNSLNVHKRQQYIDISATSAARGDELRITKITHNNECNVRNTAHLKKKRVVLLTTDWTIKSTDTTNCRCIPQYIDKAWSSIYTTRIRARSTFVLANCAVTKQRSSISRCRNIVG